MDIKSRELLLARLAGDLVGPFSADEVLDARPSDVYLSGILWPRKTRMSEEDDDKLGIGGGDSGGDADMSGAVAEEEAVSVRSMNRPSAAGISFVRES